MSSNYSIPRILVSAIQSTRMTTMIWWPCDTSRKITGIKRLRPWISVPKKLMVNYRISNDRIWSVLTWALTPPNGLIYLTTKQSLETVPWVLILPKSLKSTTLQIFHHHNFCPSTKLSKTSGLKIPKSVSRKKSRCSISLSI